jgi:cell wall-associated NlpC family hydrolase
VTGINTADIVGTALAFRGVPYRSGGDDPRGFDCSGLVQYVFAQHGVALPRGTREQFQFGINVRLAAVEPGDLIFFSTSTGGPSHVGVAIGGDEFVHAPSTRGVVRVERFSAPYWASRIVGVRRLAR